jgi:hypothetical protein
MENSQELATDVLVEETVMVEETSPEMEPTLESGDEPTQSGDEPVQEMSELDMLINRRTGYFPVKLELADLKWIKNACNGGKFTFTGPNEAFMVMNCFLGFSSAIARLEQEQDENTESSGSVQIQASALEAAAILLNKFEGSSLESAQRVFRIAVALNTSVMEMKELDRIIQTIKVGMAKQDELDNIEAQGNSPE